MSAHAQVNVAASIQDNIIIMVFIYPGLASMWAKLMYVEAPMGTYPGHYSITAPDLGPVYYDIVCTCTIKF